MRLGFARVLRRDATPAERKLWQRLRGLEPKFRRQAPIGPYVADFFCAAAKLIVEVDGVTHVDAVRDHARTAWLEARGSHVLRFWNNEVLGNTDGVVTRILEHSSPSPLEGEGRGEG